MRSPSRPPESNKLLTFVVLSLLSVVLWAITVYVWYQAYLWFEWVTQPTAILTLAVIPLPFLAYQRFTGASGLPMERRTGQPSATPAGAAPAPAPAAAPSTNPLYEWLVWLGNGEQHRGTLVVFIFTFWTILYWSLPTISFTALTFSAWGLLTILGIMILRFFFRPSREVSAANETKSRPK